MIKRIVKIPAACIYILKALLDDILFEICYNIDMFYEGITFMFDRHEDREISAMSDIEITDLRLGVGKAIDNGKNVIYYLRIKTHKGEFLFLNSKETFEIEKPGEMPAMDLINFEWND